jgi:hypothetical protein
MDKQTYMPKWHMFCGLLAFDQAYPKEVSLTQTQEIMTLQKHYSPCFITTYCVGEQHEEDDNEIAVS